MIICLGFGAIANGYTQEPRVALQYETPEPPGMFQKELLHPKGATDAKAYDLECGGLRPPVLGHRPATKRKTTSTLQQRVQLPNHVFGPVLNPKLNEMYLCGGDEHAEEPYFRCPQTASRRSK